MSRRSTKRSVSENLGHRFVVAIAAERPVVERLEQLGSLVAGEFDASGRTDFVEGRANAIVSLHVLKPAHERLPIVPRDDRFAAVARDGDGAVEALGHGGEAT
jgi:hypothetical protein